jgi:hypothetical protein
MTYQDAINDHFRKCMTAGGAELAGEKEGELSLLRELLSEARDDIRNWQQAYCLAGPSQELLARIDAALADVGS